MDLYTKFMMQSSGEQKFQPNSASERRVLATLNTLLKQEWFAVQFRGLSREAKEAMLNEVLTVDCRITERFN